MVKFLSKLKRKKKSVPFHFEIHDEQFELSVVSDIAKTKVYAMFSKGMKRIRQKKNLFEEDNMPESFSANKSQLKSLARLVVNARFLNDISEQVRLDVPTFNIIDSGLAELTWESSSLTHYQQKIVIKGICYYEE